MTDATADRFVCRREGHIPAVYLTVDNSSTLMVESYFTQCARCERWMEIGTNDAGESNSQPSADR